MNLDETDADKRPEKAPAKKKLTRKEKKLAKKAELEAAKKEKASQEKPAPTPQKVPEEIEEVDVKLDPSPVNEIPPPEYSAWEKISPPARRKKQISNMESGYREVLSLVQSMRTNQEVLLDAFQKLPEAVESVRKLADHSAQQSDILKAMNDQMGNSAAGEFNKTLTSMDQTTQLLLERAQRSEEKLYSMLRRAQRRIAFMTLLVLMLFFGAVAAVMFIAFPDKADQFLEKVGLGPSPVIEETVEMDVEDEELIEDDVSEAVVVNMEEEDLAEPVVLEIPELAEVSEQIEETVAELEIPEVLDESVEEVQAELPEVEEVIPAAEVEEVIDVSDLPEVEEVVEEQELVVESVEPVIEESEAETEVVLPQEAPAELIAE